MKCADVGLRNFGIVLKPKWRKGFDTNIDDSDKEIAIEISEFQKS